MPEICRSVNLKVSFKSFITAISQALPEICRGVKCMLLRIMY